MLSILLLHYLHFISYGGKDNEHVTRLVKLFYCTCVTLILIYCVKLLQGKVNCSDGRWLAGPLETHSEAAGAQRTVCRRWFWTKQRGDINILSYHHHHRHHLTAKIRW